MSDKRCRFCNSSSMQSFVDLGMSSLSNGYLRSEDLYKRESFYPLHAYVCEECFLVQLEKFESPQKIFSDYAYFSSFSNSWLKHVEKYTKQIVERFMIDKNSQIIEIASNDGYLLQYFKNAGIPVLGIEPAKNVAQEARKKGIPTRTDFFCNDFAITLKNENTVADLIIGNNVLAHVPELNDFVSGMKTVLKTKGIITMEFPHVLKLIEHNQFDTIYHEHFSYLSLMTVKEIFEKNGLSIFDVEEIPTHGGSLRIYAKHVEDNSKQICHGVSRVLKKELLAGLDKKEIYMNFSERVKQTKRNILGLLIKIKNEKKTIVGYGAPAKGNTLLNYCGIGTDFIDYTVDKSPYKQALYLPGTHIPIFSPDKIKETKPDYVVILPWNLRDEIIEQISYIKEWGGKFVILIPTIEVI